MVNVDKLVKQAVQAAGDVVMAELTPLLPNGGGGGGGRSYGSPMVPQRPRKPRTPRMPKQHIRVPQRSPISPTITTILEDQRRDRRRLGATHSRSKGFLKLRRQAKKKKLKGASAAKGIHGTLEHGAVLTALDAIYAGHCTAPRDVIMRIAFQAALKQLAKTMGIRIIDLDDSVTAGPYFLGTNDEFKFEYYSSAESTTTTVITHIVGIGNTWRQIAQTFANIVFATPEQSQIIPSYLRFTNSTSEYQPCRLELKYTYFMFDMKSSMKLQNRTINAAGENEADDVDNVPIYGKSIGGSGTGCQALFPNSSSPGQIVCDLANGTIDKTSLSNNLKEPLSGFFFPKSTKQGKVRLDPGEIRTNVLRYKKNVTLQTLFKAFAYSGSTKVIAPFGNFVFFQLEKMIDSGSALNIILAYETNLEYNCVCVPKMNWVTAPTYAKF